MATNCQPGTCSETPSLHLRSHTENKSISTVFGALCHFLLSPSFYSPVNISLRHLPPRPPSPAGLRRTSTCSCHADWRFIPGSGQAPGHDSNSVRRVRGHMHFTVHACVKTGGCIKRGTPSECTCCCVGAHVMDPVSTRHHCGSHW